MAHVIFRVGTFATVVGVGTSFSDGLQEFFERSAGESPYLKYSIGAASKQGVKDKGGFPFIVYLHL